MGNLAFTISNLFRNNPGTISSYFERLSQTVLILIDRAGDIHDCNQVLLDVLNLSQKPVQMKIGELLSPESKEFSLPSDDGYVPLKLNFTGPDTIQITLAGYIFSVEGGYMLIFEKHKLTYNELIKKMSFLNNELTNLTRELDKKNRELEKANATITEIMNIDPLTGLLNRRAFMEILRKSMAFSRRHGLPLSLVMSDIDHFKVVNDTYGHEAGDFVLKFISKILNKSCRVEDTVARFGGEEFLSLLPNTYASSAIHCADRLRRKIETVSVPNIADKISASFGVTEILSSDSEESFIKRADDALYEAKNKGRNCCVMK
jgi:two-component system, cell cycle response regulator